MPCALLLNDLRIYQRVFARFLMSCLFLINFTLLNTIAGHCNMEIFETTPSISEKIILFCGVKVCSCVMVRALQKTLKTINNLCIVFIKSPFYFLVVTCTFTAVLLQ